MLTFSQTCFRILFHILEKDLNSCDLCLVVGTSSIVYPAAMFAPQVLLEGSQLQSLIWKLLLPLLILSKFNISKQLVGA